MDFFPPVPYWEWFRRHPKLDSHNIVSVHFDYLSSALEGVFSKDRKHFLNESLKIVGDNGGGTPEPIYFIDVWGGIQVLFYHSRDGWIVSVLSPDDLSLLWPNVFDTETDVSRELKGDWIYGPYSENHRIFSMRLSSGFLIAAFLLFLQTGIKH